MIRTMREPGDAPAPARAIRTRRASTSGCGLAALALVAGGAGAQQLDDQVGVAVGDARLFPSVRIDYLFDSNVGLRDDDEVEGEAVVVRPRLDFVAERRQLRLEAGYAGTYSASSESALEYADHELFAALAAEFDARRRASVGLSLAREHDDLGFDLTRGLADVFDEPVRYNTLSLDTRFTYGVVDARGNLFAGLDLESLSYTNLPSVTDGRDFVLVEPYAAFGYRLSSDTRAIAEIRFSSAAFEDGDDDRDEVSVLGGADFAATGKLRGGFRLGASRASFARDDVDDEVAIVTRANVDWLPREYATIRLDLVREFDNTTSTRVGEDQSIRTVARLGWEHEWSSRLSTDAFAQLVDVARACPNRATSTGSIGAELDLAVRRWLEVGASVVQASRTADECGAGGDAADDGLDFDRTLYGVHVRATL